MKSLRIALSAITVVGLTVGYLGSQIAALTGPESALEYAQKVDTAPVRLIALAILIAAVVLAFVPEREDPA